MPLQLDTHTYVCQIHTCMYVSDTHAYVGTRTCDICVKQKSASSFKNSGFSCWKMSIV